MIPIDLYPYAHYIEMELRKTMSCPLYCPECDAFQGDAGMTASGEEECTNCGATFEVAHQTLAEVGQ